MEGGTSVLKNELFRQPENIAAKVYITLGKIKFTLTIPKTCQSDWLQQGSSGVWQTCTRRHEATQECVCGSL